MSGSGADFVNYLIANFKNLPYTWGNNDCSGIVRKGLAAIGISIPAGSAAQWQASTPIDPSQAQPGDLFFYNPGTSGAPPGLPGHVAVYVGGGMLFEAYNTSRPIGFDSVANMASSDTFMGVRRPPGLNGAPGVVSTGTGGTGTISAVPVSSSDPSTQTVATGSGTTCAFALGTHNKVLIWNVDFSVCVISKTEARAVIGAMAMGGGVIVSLVGMALVLQYALDKSGMIDAVGKTAPAVAGMLIK